MMSRPWQRFEGPPRHFFNDHPPDVYAGPEEFMEVGARGFLVSTLAGKEEFGVDDAIELLRQATVKLYGGIKPRSKKFATNLGYVKIDFMDPEAVTVLPTPEGEEEEEPEEQEDEKAKSDEAEKKESKSDEANTEEGEEESKPEKMEEEGEDSEEKQEEDAEKKEDTEEKDEKAEEEETVDDDKSKEGETRDDGEKKDEKTKDKDDKKEEVKKPEPQKEEVPHMRSTYKFKAFRTEIRNIMFIKSNVPDPQKVAETAMEIIIERKTIAGDAVNQLLPVLGVCKYDYLQLEMMTRRVLAPIFDETLEPKGFSVLLVDKLSEPGSELLVETVRNAVWAVNPLAWLASPLTEPEVVIRLELLGSKLVLCCLTNFMRYRHYSPKLLIQMGVGEPEDDDGTWISTEERKRQEMWRAEQEKRREMERQREEERRKEREKRRAEAEARRAEAEAKRKEEEAKRKERSKESKKDAEEGNKESSKEEDEKEETDEKAAETKSDEEMKEKEEDDTEESSEKANTEEQASERKEVGRRRRSQNTASPPKKKARKESSEAEPEEGENEDDGEESEEEEEETKGKKKTKSSKFRGKRAGRRKQKK